MRSRRVSVLTFLMLMAFITFSCADMDERSDRLSSGQLSVFSPGYVNATMQKTREIMYQSNRHKGPIENVTESIKDKLSDKVMEDSANEVKPELRKKKGGDAGNSAQNVSTASIESKVIDSSEYNVAIGSGNDKEYDNDGRLMAEVIDNTRYVYAGFDTVGKSTIQGALDMAREGDSVIVKSGNYNSYWGYYGDNWNYIENPDGAVCIKNGVSLYGGYDEAGVRDLEKAPTIINGFIIAEAVDKPTEFNGFNMKGGQDYFDAGIYVYNSSALTISDSVFSSSYEWASGIRLNDSSLVQVKNNIFNTYFGVDVSGVYDGWLNDLCGNNYYCVFGTPTSVVSMNNDYNGDYGVLLQGQLTFTSEGDYFVGESFQDNTYSSTYTPIFSTSNTLAHSNTVRYVDRILNNTALAQNLTNTLLRTEINDYGIGSLSEANANDRQKWISSSELSPMISGLLKSRDNILVKEGGQIDANVIRKIIDDATIKASLSVPIEISSDEMRLAMTLANIIKDPTEVQKAMLDTIKGLLNEVDKQQNETDSPELKKASDDLLQMVASVLIAQAIPDLLKEGDVAGVKNIFTELNAMKMNIMTDYTESVKPYYDEIKKLLSKNIALLQLNNIVSKSMMAEEMAKLEPNQLDKILEKLRKASNKSFEEEYILQQEAKYRRQYIDPNKKVLEERMKGMMKDFTERLSKALEATKK